jgi:predicted nucleic acid-binding protein
MEAFEFRNIETLKLPGREHGISFLLMGSTRSGKSTLLNYLYENIFKQYITILHTASAQSEIYKPFRHTAVASEYHPELLEESYKINKRTNNEYEFLHILDDIVDKKNDPEVRKLLTIYRNSRISGIITGQSLTIFNNIARGNINYVCLGYLNNDSNVEAVIKAYLISYFPSAMRMGDRIKSYREMTKNHHFIVIDSIHGEVFRTCLNRSQIVS